MNFFDHVRIFFVPLKSLHKQPVAVCLVLLLTISVVVLGAVQSSLTAHPPRSVTLACAPTPSPCVIDFPSFYRGEKSGSYSEVIEIGYTLYRREKSGSYSRQPVNSHLIKEPKYTDTSVLTARTYFYVVKAQCGGNESEPSNEIKVDVPYKLRR